MRSARKGPVWGARAPSRAGDGVLVIADFSSPSDTAPVALRVRCGEGAATSTRGRVRSPETPAVHQRDGEDKGYGKGDVLKHELRREGISYYLLRSDVFLPGEQLLEAGIVAPFQLGEEVARVHGEGAGDSVV